MTLSLATRRTRSFLRATRIGASVLASATLGACAADHLVTPQDRSVATIDVASNGAATLTSLGDTVTVRPQLRDAHGAPITGVKLRWTVSPGNVLGADGNGVYHALTNGRATIVVDLDPSETGVHPAGYYATRVADSMIVTVQQRAATLRLAPLDTAFTTLGGSRQMRVGIADARGNAMLVMPRLAWLSTNPGIVQVDSLGLVRSTNEGWASVLVQTEGLAAQATFTVNPRLPHTSCMVFSQRHQTKQSCVTLDLVVREREGGQ
jgi:hypothetical protein